jgi:hypothetical protein
LNWLYFSERLALPTNAKKVMRITAVSFILIIAIQ